MERRVFDKLQYVVKEPGKPAEKNPAIIFLHGAGTRGTDIGVLERNSFFKENSHISDEDSPFMVFAPLCSRDSWFDVFEQLQEFVKMVAAHPAVDANRLYQHGRLRLLAAGHDHAGVFRGAGSCLWRRYELECKAAHPYPGLGVPRQGR